MAEIGVEPLQGSPFIGELFCLVPQEGKSGRTDNQNTSFAEEGGVGSWVVDVCAGLNHSHLSHVALGRRAIVLAPWPRRVQTPITSLQQVFKGGLPHVHAFQQFGPHRSALLPSRPVSFHVRGFEQYGLLGLRCGEASDVQRLHSAVQGMPPLSLSRAAVAQKTLYTLSIYSCFVARCTTDLDCLSDTFPRRDARQHYLAISLASRQRTCRQRPTSTSRWW